MQFVPLHVRRSPQPDFPHILRLDFCRQISGGEYRKTIIARAMAQESELLLLDEPTTNLDLGWRERMVETVETLCAQNCSTG